MLATPRVIAVLAVLLACGGSQAPSDPEAPGAGDEGSCAVVGSWQTRGESPDLGGTVDVTLELGSSGRLRVTVSPAAGGSLNFPGSWALTDHELRLRGAYFGPAGETVVRCRPSGDSLLVLEDSTGGVERWRRLR